MEVIRQDRAVSWRACLNQGQVRQTVIFELRSLANVAMEFVGAARHGDWLKVQVWQIAGPDPEFDWQWKGRKKTCRP
jgi:hypothetical protein